MAGIELVCGQGGLQHTASFCSISLSSSLVFLPMQHAFAGRFGSGAGNAQEEGIKLIEILSAKLALHNAGNAAQTAGIIWEACQPLYRDQC
ncbi:MAG: hypothetical protein R3D55_26285 [Chloroflexota bacterium]